MSFSGGRLRFWVLFVIIFQMFSCPFIGKIYDCFPFFNELEILEIRLNELYDVVDKFVLVEMEETHQGKEKPFYFNENKYLFEKFLDKIIHVQISGRLSTSDSWVREGFQRNQIIRGLIDCKDEDIILISDVDEIVSADAIPRIRELLKSHWLVRCHQRFFRLFLNVESRSWNPWTGTFAVRFRDLKKRNIDRLRKSYSHNMPPPSLPCYELYDAGWHFSSLGGLERFCQKLEAYAHVEINTPDCKSQTYMEQLIHEECKMSEIDSSFPSYILKNLDVYQSKGFVYEGPEKLMKNSKFL